MFDQITSTIKLGGFVANTEQRDWNKERLEKREKLTYALMAAAGGCTGYAMTQVKDLRPECAHWVLAFALFLWAGSFWCGYKKVEAEIDCLLQQGILEGNLNQPTEFKAANAYALHGVMQDQLEKIGVANQQFQRNERFQVGTLIGGTVMYGVWQTLMMFSRNLSLPT